MQSKRMPVVFLPHGGGPWPFVDLGLPASEMDAFSGYLASLPEVAPEPPRALLVISAHWEEGVPTVMASRNPPMLYDYYGFPSASYSIQWPAPGSPELALRVRELLGGAGFATEADPRRGFDHGAFVPLKVAYPDANIPAIQLSLKAGLDPDEHLALGRALAPLRDEGVLIVASGMTFHNLRMFGSRQAVPLSEAFDDWLAESMALPVPERNRRLAKWTDAPAARLVHPREEHLLPLHIAAGAAEDDRARVAFHGTFMGVRLSAYHFGV